MHMKFREKIFILTLKAIGQLSLKNINRLASFITQIIYLFPFRFKAIIEINLERCLPHLSPKNRALLKEKVIFHTILRFLEMPLFWFGNQAQVKIESTGEADFLEDIKLKKGLIILVPHIGAWETVNCYIAPRLPSASLYKPAKKAYQEELLRLARERHGIEMHPATLGGVKRLFAALKRGKCAGILPDHDPGDNGGLMAPFFGIPANTTTLIAKLASKSKAPVYFILPKRLENAKGFHLYFVKASENLASPDLNQATQALNQEIQDLIMRCPEQYDWAYKRFRRTPWETGPFYDT